MPRQLSSPAEAAPSPSPQRVASPPRLASPEPAAAAAAAALPEAAPVRLTRAVATVWRMLGKAAGGRGGAASASEDEVLELEALCRLLPTQVDFLRAAAFPAGGVTRAAFAAAYLVAPSKLEGLAADVDIFVCDTWPEKAPGKDAAAAAAAAAAGPAAPSSSNGNSLHRLKVREAKLADRVCDAMCGATEADLRVLSARHARLAPLLAKGVGKVPRKELTEALLEDKELLYDVAREADISLKGLFLRKGEEEQQEGVAEARESSRASTSSGSTVGVGKKRESASSLKGGAAPEPPAPEDKHAGLPQASKERPSGAGKAAENAGQSSVSEAAKPHAPATENKAAPEHKLAGAVAGRAIATAAGRAKASGDREDKVAPRRKASKKLMLLRSWSSGTSEDAVLRAAVPNAPQGSDMRKDCTIS